MSDGTFLLNDLYWTPGASAPEEWRSQRFLRLAKSQFPGAERLETPGWNCFESHNESQI